MNLLSPLENIKGVGPKAAEQFLAAGLKTVGDLINFFPRSYEDFSSFSNISDIKPGKVTIKAKCESISTRPVRRGLRLTTATLSDNSGKLQAIWFNQPYRETQLKSDKEFYFSGEFEFNYNRYQLTNPSAELTSEVKNQSGRLLPTYRAIKGLKTVLVRKIIKEIRPLMKFLPETLPQQLIDREKLIAYGEALDKLHFPTNNHDIELARERLAFEEIFHLILASQLNKQENSAQKGWSIPFKLPVIKDFVSKLPFELTNAQRLAAWDIIKDLEKPTPMNRLLQGDVGSGKTVVAGLAACQVSYYGYQTAIMAPTEILATQHAETLDKLLRPFGIKVALLTGFVKTANRKALYEAIESGEINVIVGTHALIQDKVNFNKLGFVVIDEQHRFGVKQRQKLVDKAHVMPHLLLMTATPIPRSLALTVFGELEISILNEMPKGRKPIITKIWSPNSRAQLFELIEKELLNGRQCYVICSLIEENPDNDIKSVEAEYKILKNSVFKHRKIGLLHGKLSGDEKDQVMRDFKDGKYDILVSTTVVEVGVDVPNSTIMIIENADRFGLAQLHQLRGRVGRGEHQSYCYLINSTSNKPSKRLQEIEKSNDGFYLAEVDLKMRGPGEIYGQAQHGELNLKITTLADTKMIVRARKSVQYFLDNKIDMLQYKELATRVHRYQRLTTLN